MTRKIIVWLLVGATYCAKLGVPGSLTAIELLFRMRGVKVNATIVDDR